MAWCENNGVDFLFGLAKNARLDAEIEAELAPAQEHKPADRQARPALPGLHLATRESWSRKRRVVAKAEWTDGEANPRFVVTSLSARGARGPPPLRKALLRPRRDGKPHQGVPARPVCRSHLGPTMRANQLRLWFAAMAYVLICALRRIGLAHTQFAQASCGTIRLKLLKIGALVRISCAASSSPCPRPSPIRPSTAPRTPRSSPPCADTNQKTRPTTTLQTRPKDQCPR